MGSLTPWVAAAAVSASVLLLALRDAAPEAGHKRTATEDDAPTVVGSSSDESSAEERPRYRWMQPPVVLETETFDDIYDIEADSVLGKGSFGTVVTARHRASGRLVAVKRMNNLTSTERAAAINEYALQARLQHPNIVRPVACFAHGDSVQLVLELASGGTLAAASLPLAESNVREIATALLQGLEHCHAAGIVHRDLKPTNVLLHRQGDFRSAQLADFGLAEKTRGRRVPLTDRSGTEEFMAPEVQRRERYGTAVDIYSLGVLLHVLATGQSLGEDRRPAFSARLSAEFQAFVASMLEADARKRPTASALLAHPCLARH
ncbi:serine/threonine protein kinase [Achlya hypogyna]|uniref:Secreted protein n=1 Tax=Achlya hypogyna TaxID=1202772 RepID=A0A0A7CP70_ACHHY|nr:secreted protein [Achlya hypogyna]OQR86816.1 serine/threonine protein kinase [Achlya hypogyna]